MTKPINDFSPDWVSHPGETIADLMEEKGWTQVELAERLGCSEKHLNQLIHGKVTLTTETATLLARVLGASVDFWLAREANYQRHKARLKAEKQFTHWVPWLDKLPVKQLMKINAIPTLRNDAKNKPKIVEHCLKFFSVASPDGWSQRYERLEFQFRRNTSQTTDIGAISSWLRLGEIEAESNELKKYDQTKFKTALSEIREMTTLTPAEFYPEIRRLLLDAGVFIALVPAIPKARVSGVARWLSPTKPLIQLSLYGKSNDKFWFTFFHEAAHILLHAKGAQAKESIFLDTFDNSVLNDAQEQEANSWAANILIPMRYQKELSLLKTEEEIIHFAQRLNIHPGIVIGRLQHEQLKPFSYGNHLKSSFEYQ